MNTEKKERNGNSDTFLNMSRPPLKFIHAEVCPLYSYSTTEYAIRIRIKGKYSDEKYPCLYERACKSEKSYGKRKPVKSLAPCFPTVSSIRTYRGKYRGEKKYTSSS